MRENLLSLRDYLLNEACDEPDIQKLMAAIACVRDQCLLTGAADQDMNHGLKLAILAKVIELLYKKQPHKFLDDDLKKELHDLLAKTEII